MNESLLERVNAQDYLHSINVHPRSAKTRLPDVYYPSTYILRTLTGLLSIPQKLFSNFPTQNIKVRIFRFGDG